MKNIERNIIEYVDATPLDSSLVGWTFLTAMGLDSGRFPNLEEVVLREDTLYSWKNARIAVCDGRKAGCLIAYSGNDYVAMRDRTWSLLTDISREDLEKMEPEAFPGEYYLDSLAVLPEFRGSGIGGALIRDSLRPLPRVSPARLSSARRNPTTMPCAATIRALDSVNMPK